MSEPNKLTITIDFNTDIDPDKLEAQLWDYFADWGDIIELHIQKRPDREE